MGLMAAQIDADQLRQLVADGAQLIEVLPAKEYEEDHLPGARSIPLGKLDAPAVATLDEAHPIVVYCWDVA
jgi:rhodanese-related sulfurtransferase